VGSILGGKGTKNQEQAMDLARAGVLGPSIFGDFFWVLWTPQLPYPINYHFGQSLNKTYKTLIINNYFVI
jgi:hypothetical protein